MEDLKERYYEVAGTLTKIRADPTMPEPKVYVFDADSERRRKEQLDRLWKRTPEQVSYNVELPFMFIIDFKYLIAMVSITTG